MNLVVNFWVFIIGVISMLVYGIWDASSREYSRERKQKEREQHVALMHKYSLSQDDIAEFNWYCEHSWMVGKILQEEIDAIVEANPSVNATYVRKRYWLPLLNAYYGCCHYHELLIRGGPLGIAESTALAQQIEKLMRRNGFYEFEYVFVPRDGYSVNDYDHMALGKFVMREYEDISLYRRPYKRMWEWVEIEE